MIILTSELKIKLFKLGLKYHISALFWNEAEKMIDDFATEYGQITEKRIEGLKASI